VRRIAAEQVAGAGLTPAPAVINSPQVLRSGITYLPEQRERVRHFTRRLKVNYPIVLGTQETKASFSPDETLPLTVIIDRGGTIRGVIAGILLPAEFNLHIKPLFQQRASERETNHVQQNK
jgi:hypothetical protein